MKTQAMILKAIDGIKRSGQSLDNKIQETACDVLQHIEEHSEVSLACKLFQAMPNGSRRAALVEFLIQNGKVMPNPDKKTRSERPFVFNKKGPAFSATRVSAKPWFEYKKESQAQVFGEQALLDAVKVLQKRVEAAVQAGTLSKDHPKVLALRNLA